MTATSFPKISRGKSKNQSDKMRLFPNKSSVLRTRNQQKWIGSRSRKSQSSSELSGTTKPNRCQVVLGTLFILQTVYQKLCYESTTIA